MPVSRRARRTPRRIRDLLLVGEGNIGSHLISHVARLDGLRRVTLVDPDRYEPANLGGQDIQPGDVGRPKAEVQARRLRRLCPGLEVRSFAAAVEDVPLGLLQSDVILTGLDSRAARCRVNESAWRLGVTAWIDAGVDARQMLARVTVHLPRAVEPCYECSLGAADYAAMEQQLGCTRDAPTVAATAAPSSLGALAAALQALELQKMLAGQWELVAANQELLFDARTGRSLVTRLTRNPACRFDHCHWPITRLEQAADQLTLDSAFDLLAVGHNAAGRTELGVAGRMIVRRLTCLRCGAMTRPRWTVESRRQNAERRCSRCGGPLAGSATDTYDWLEESMLPRHRRQLSLTRLGLRGGDVLVLRRGARVRYFELPEANHA